MNIDICLYIFVYLYFKYLHDTIYTYYMTIRKEVFFLSYFILFILSIPYPRIEKCICNKKKKKTV